MARWSSNVMKFVYALLLLGVIKCIILYKVFYSIPALELKRRAKSKDRRASALHKAAAYEKSLTVLLWLFGTAMSVMLFIWSARTSWWLAAIVLVLIAWLVVWGKFPASGWAGRVAAFVAPVYWRLLYYLNPLFSRLAVIFPSNTSIHTKVYEKNDLLELLNRQNKQVDNRISGDDLQIAFNAMTFGDKNVSKIMTPRRLVKMVGINDNIGPLLMDELHKSGFSRFPVVKDSVKSASPEIVGTLYLNNLIGYEGGGKVKDLARREVYFINEDSNLHQALGAFLKTHHHLLIVVNSFEEMVGVISLEDIMQQILGKKIMDDFDNYEDLRSVPPGPVLKKTILKKR